jgi:hypothetical protein
VRKDEKILVGTIGLTILAIVTSLMAMTAVNSSPRQPANQVTLDQPAVVMECLDESLEQYSVFWQKEIGRRFPKAVGILVHGGDFVEGEWIVGTSWARHRHVTPLKTVVQHYQKLYPDRTVVVLACNPGHLKLGIPGVFYSHSNVWCIPDRALEESMFFQNARFVITSGEQLRGDDSRPRNDQWPDVVGNIFEFLSE